MSIYVKMLSIATSGGGSVDGKIDLHVVECETQDQADQIVKAAKGGRMGEMSQIRQVMHRPRDTDQTKVTLQKFSELTGEGDQCG